MGQFIKDMHSKNIRVILVYNGLFSGQRLSLIRNVQSSKKESTNTIFLTTAKLSNGGEEKEPL